MALEPAMPVAGEVANPELTDFTRRLIVAAVLCVPPLLLLSMIRPILSWTFASDAAAPWLQLAVCAPIVAWCGLPFFKRGWISLHTGHFNMITLISTGVSVALQTK